MGSKNKLADKLLSIILKNRKSNQWYVEPFVGGANLIDKVDGNRIGNDNHYYLIKMWEALQAGWEPPTVITREEYYEIKRTKEYCLPALVGFVGFLCSFGGKWWGGYAANKKSDNYADRGSRMLLKQIKNLKNVIFSNYNYWEMNIPLNSLIYCDPPYKGTTKYNYNKVTFDYDFFWNWVKNMTDGGHDVFVSEYAAPRDFICIEQFPHKTILNKNSQDSRIEKLFIHNKLLNHND